MVTRNDALNSALSVFFIAGAFVPMVMLMVSTEEGIIGTLNYVLIIFSLIFTAQGQARRATNIAGKSNEEIRLELAKQKHADQAQRDPFGIMRLFYFFGHEGIVLIFLGTFFGYNLLQIEYFHSRSNGIQFNPFFEVTFFLL